MTLVVTPVATSRLAETLRQTRRFGWTMGLCFAASVFFVGLSLWYWGAVEVRGHLDETILLTLLGCVWMIVCVYLFQWFGVGVRDDVIERQNPAALVALCGAMVAVALTYAFGNCGEGPSYWNNIFSTALSTAGLFLLWFVLEFYSAVSVSITEERDLASGTRLSGFLFASGLILGRAVAGDWHSESATVHDLLRDGWPAAGLCLVAMMVESLAGPSRKRPCPPWFSHGLVPALVYVVVAAFWVAHLGRWEGMPA